MGRRTVDVFSGMSPSTTKLMTKRSSIVKIGTVMTKFGTSLGRFVGVTQEHVQTMEVLKAEDVFVESPEKSMDDTLKSWNSINISNMNIKGIREDRRRSMPI